MPDFYTLITDIGQAKLASAIANNTVVQINEFSVGDGGSASYDPSSSQTSLINEVFRDTVNRKFTDQANAANAVIECIIPESVGGWYIREVGLYDSDGDLFAIAKYPPTFKPDNNSSLVKRFIVQMILAVVNADNVSVTTDAAGIVTQDYLDNLHSSTTVIGITRYSTDAEALIMEEANAALTPSNLSSVLGHKVATSVANGVTGTAMTLNGTLLSLGLISPSFNVGFDYRMVGQPDFTRTALTAKTSIGAFSVNLTSLLQNTTYEFKAVAVDPATTRIVYGVLITVTTPNTSPSDYTINVVGTTDGTLNDPLNTTTINAVANGYVDNVNARVIATADNCTAATKEYAQLTGDPDFVLINTSYQFSPLKLAIGAATTTSSIVVTSPKAGLLTNGGSLWVDDGGTMKEVTTASVVEGVADNSGAPWNTASTNTNPMGNWSAMAYGNGVIIICGASSTNAFVIARSFDSGTTWSSYNLSISVDGRPGLCYANGKWILAVGYDVKYSLDNGTTWINATITLSGGAFGTVCYGNGKFILIPKLGGNVYSSVDGITWTVIGSIGAIDPGQNYHYLGLIYANGKFLVCGSGTVHSSSDGVVWTAHYIGSFLSGIAYGAGLYVTISQSSIKSSSDLVTWTDREATPGGRPGGITFANGIFAAVACEGDFPYISVRTFTSIDGLSWIRTTQPSLVAGFANLIVYTGSLFFVCSGVTVFDAGVPNQQASALAYTSTAGAIPKYTCTGITPALTNAPTAVYKAGQTFASSVIAASGAPSYTPGTVATVTRSGDILIVTTADRAAAGRYVRLQIGLNNGDTASRFYAGFLV